MQAIIYAARSKDEEEGKDSTGDQIAAITERIAREGDREAVGPFIDHASGYTGNRGPKLKDAIEAAVAAAPSELWVWKPNRLGRGTGRPNEARAIGQLLYELRAKGVTVRGVHEDEFLRNEMTWGMISSMASQYSASLSADVARGKRAAFEQGRWGGARFVNDGYLLGPPSERGGRGLVLDQERAPIIRRAAELVLDGLTFNAAARALNAEGHRTQDGRAWRGSRVQATVSHPVYAGYVVWHYREADQEVREGKHDAIFDAETWARLVAKLGLDPATFRRGDRKGLRSRGARGGRPSVTTVLSGLATCARCGEPMHGRRSPHTRKDGTRRVTYCCAARKEKTGTCDMPVLDASRIDAAVVEHLSDLFVDFEAWVAEQAAVTERERDVIAAELQATKRELRKREAERDTAMKRYVEKQTDTREEVLEHTREQVVAAQARVADLDARLALVPAEPQTDAMLDAFNELKRVLESDKQPLNERLKRLFAEFKLEADADGYLVEPVLRPEMIEQHGSGAVKVLDGDEASLHQALGGPGSEASPVLMIVPPPSKTLAVANTDHYAWA
jgi:DNA invertase Pin-like site-specific DNA recombinase